MTTNELLETYLNDHLAGATAGVDLAREIADDAKGTPSAAALEQVADDIEADRAVLEGLIADLGFSRHVVKHAAAWMAEKVSRFRLNRASVGSHSLALLMSMETLSMGIEGKRDLWQALTVMAGGEPAVAALDLAGLEQRAREQRAVVETCRRDVAPGALGRL